MEVLAKRSQHSVEDIVDAVLEPDNKRRETGKKTSKPGRKPLDTEPKNKRTAQNRAAQRAFRERKEQKMKDLETKINNLETDKKNANTETEFLRLQVQMLMNELAKHRGTTDLTDLNLPINPIQSSTIDVSPPSDNSSSFSPNETSISTSKSTPSLDDSKKISSSFAFEFPWSRKNSINTKSPLVSNNSSTIPTLSSNASTTSSGASPFELYNTEDQKDLPLFNQAKTSNQDFDFNEHFDEGINEFCSELNSACGTKECPIPKSKSQMPTPLPSHATINQDSKLQNDSLYFLNENNTFLNGYSTFDPSLAFDNNNSLNVDDLFEDQQVVESDPLAGLTTEESLYDPFGLFTQPKQSPIVEKNESIKTPMLQKDPNTPAIPATPVPASADDDNEVVPAEQKYLKCTEIWDRITSHPKYSDIDIDGLCNELRVKAKCSDKGVVIDYVDVNSVIERALK